MYERAVAVSVADLDAPACPLGDAAHHRESQPASGCIRVAVEPRERLEHALPLLGRYARAPVRDLDDDESALLGHR